MMVVYILAVMITMLMISIKSDCTNLDVSALYRKLKTITSLVIFTVDEILTGYSSHGC